MITARQGIKISAIVGKMGLKINNPNATREEVGADLVMQLISNAYKAEQEIYELIAGMKNCTTEEAANINLVEFFKEIAKDSGVMSFFNSAANSHTSD